MKPCPLCRQRGQTWPGQEPTCAFTTGTFRADNWNCATMNALREIGNQVVESRRYITDASAYLIPFEWEEDWDGDRGFIALAHYKNRGRTDQAVVLRDDYDAEPERLTLETALRAIRYWQRITKNPPKWLMELNTPYAGDRPERTNG